MVFPPGKYFLFLAHNFKGKVNPLAILKRIHFLEEMNIRRFHLKQISIISTIVTDKLSTLIWNSVWCVDPTSWGPVHTSNY